MNEHLIQLSYFLAAVLFILSLRWLNHPRTARRGVGAGVLGMPAAVVATLTAPEVVDYKFIALAVVAGFAVGVPLSWVPLTAVPERTALSHAFGGLAAGLVGTAKYIMWRQQSQLTTFRTSAIALEVILGFLTFTGSLMAAGKLREVIPTRPITYRNQNFVNLLLLVLAVVSGVYLAFFNPSYWPAYAALVALSLIFGALLIIPIGGADMPTVISLLNSYAGPPPAAIVRGTLRGRDGLRARQQAPDHCRRARRIVGVHPVGHHVQGDEPLVQQRALRCVRAGPADYGQGRSQDREERDAAGRRRHHDARGSGRRRAGLRDGGGAGAAPRPRALRSADQARHRREVRDPSRRGTDAGAHERAACRSRDPVRVARRDGRHQSRHAADGCVPRRRRQRRRQSGGAPRQGQPDLRDADHRRRQSQNRHRDQTLDEPGVRR